MSGVLYAGGPYAFYAVELTTGRVLADLPLVETSLGRHLAGGTFSASMPLAQLDEARRRELIDVTQPGRCSIVAERDGVIVGEWVIWRRSREHGFAPVRLNGAELITWPRTQLLTAVTYVDEEQLDIAADLVRRAFWMDQIEGSPGSVAMNVPDPTPSGVPRDRTYLRVESSIGARLEELAGVDDGFEYTIELAWARVGGLRYVSRTWRFWYPQAGAETAYTLDLASPAWPTVEGVSDPYRAAQGGSIVEFSVDEDATRLASWAYAIGSGEGSDKIIGSATSTDLVDAGYPRTYVSRAWSTVTKLSTANSYARALLGISQTTEVPPTVTVLADADPAIGDYSLGDRVWLALEPSTNFPDGYTTRVRILGWTLAPPAAGPEVVALEVTSIGADLEGD